jgi:hypothetical protein
MSIVIDHGLVASSRGDVAKNFLKNAYAELISLGIEGVV